MAAIQLSFCIIGKDLVARKHKRLSYNPIPPWDVQFTERKFFVYGKTGLSTAFLLITLDCTGICTIYGRMGERIYKQNEDSSVKRNMENFHRRY